MKMDWNIYFDSRPEAKPESMTFAGATLDQWRQRGHDTHSIITDPGFIAPQRNDFELRADSPAIRLGFQPIELRGIGPSS